MTRIRLPSLTMETNSQTHMEIDQPDPPSNHADANAVMKTDSDLATPDAVTERTLLNLPPEILHHVCNFLTIKDIRKMRLVCHRLAVIGAPHALPEVIFFLHKGDFEALRTIASDPVYSKHVRSLVYVTEILAPEQLTYREYAAGRRRHERMQRHLALHHDDAVMRHVPREARRRRFPAPSPSKSPEQIKASFREYKKAHASQAQLLASREDFAVLREVVAKFTNLEDVLISSDRAFREGPYYGNKSPFSHLYCHAHSYLHPEGARQTRSMLEALYAAGTRLKGFRFGTIHWDFFRQPKFEAAKWGTFLRHLTSFEVMIQTDSERDGDAGHGGGDMDSMDGNDNDQADDVSAFDDDDADWGDDTPEVERCRRVLKSGSLRTLISHMPNLEILSIMFTYQDDAEENTSYPASLDDLIPRGMKWPNLETLRMEIFESDREELIAFLVRHKDSLLELHLKDLRLVNTSWLLFLPQLKREMETSYMTDVLISGIVYGHNEDPHAPANEDEETWDLGDPELGNPDELCLADEISEYLLAAGEWKCPLTRENQETSYHW